MEEEELIFELIRDPELKKTMKDALFSDFYVLVGIGLDKKHFPINLTMAAMFSLTFREFLVKIKNQSVVAGWVEYPMVDSQDFKIVYNLLTRGNVIKRKAEILGALKMASFFQISTLMTFLVDFIERNEDFIDMMDLFLFSFEANSQNLYSLAKHRVTDMGEAPFFSEHIL